MALPGDVIPGLLAAVVEWHELSSQRFSPWR